MIDRDGHCRCSAAFMEQLKENERLRCELDALIQYLGPDLATRIIAKAPKKDSNDV